MSSIAQIETRPDFRHVNAWIFDLDNTLYSADCGLFGHIDRRMAQFVAELLRVSSEEARAIQKAYYREHGTTLNGLMRVHGVDPEAYLAYVHDIDLSAIACDPGLNAILPRLKGRRFIFTNGCRHHAGRVLERLKISNHFDDIWDIRTLSFRPKPDADAYAAVAKRAKIEPSQAAMFDDVARNLVPAHALGMTTVWIENGSEWSRQGPSSPPVSPEHIDYRTSDLAGFLRTIRI